MLVTLQRLLRPARRDGYAVGAFNVSNLEQAQAVMSAAEDLRSPVILNTSEKAIEYAGQATLAAMIFSLVRKSRVPAVLNLDHGHKLATVSSCLRAGWTGIMFDGSRLSDRVNIQKTAKAVQLARPYGAGVEGEIGRIQYRSDATKNPQPILATPEMAVTFVQKTKVVALAVGLGNNHGLPWPHERLDFYLLDRIRRVINVPLVLHGASSNSPAEIRGAIRLGIAKINIDTELRRAFTTAVRKSLRTSTEFDPRSYLAPAREAVVEAVKKKIILFGSRGKA